MSSFKSSKHEKPRICQIFKLIIQKLRRNQKTPSERIFDLRRWAAIMKISAGAARSSGNGAIVGSSAHLWLWLYFHALSISRYQVNILKIGKHNLYKFAFLGTQTWTILPTFFVVVPLWNSVTYVFVEGAAMLPVIWRIKSKHQDD